jgi:hypothetical protein
MGVWEWVTGAYSASVGWHRSDRAKAIGSVGVDIYIYICVFVVLFFSFISWYITHY